MIVKHKDQWTQSFTVDKDGFYGHLYCLDKNNFNSKALLVLGGGGMPYKFTMSEAAASYSEEINGVTALSPSSRVNMGIGPGISWVKASSWTFKGDELPYAYAKVPGWRAVLKSIRARELTFRFAYEEAYRNAGDESMIPIEKINGPVLVCGALEDSLWPSAQACDEIIDRLEKHPFKHPHKKLVYRYASHILLPFDTGYNKYFRVGRKYPGECRQTITDLRREIMDWLHM